MDTAGAVAGFESSMHISPSTSHMRTHTLHTYYHCADGPARGRVVGKQKAKTVPFGAVFLRYSRVPRARKWSRQSCFSAGRWGCRRSGFSTMTMVGA